MPSVQRGGTSLGQAAKTKLWRCGEHTRCPQTIPASDANPWDTCLTPLMQEDRERCEAWKDEIQNLLIFSGLFSAVVTAFLVQTYGDLQPDSQYYAVVLLSQLVQLQNVNGSISRPAYMPSASTAPSASSIRTNLCWFSSLVLSLIVVLVGTVALQWLREFQRYPSSSTLKKKFSTRNLRAESFEHWYAPQIIAGLPQILQLAVILFFIGLMDLLLQLNRTVAVPVILLAGLAMVFQAITTILPTLQSFWLINKSGFSEPPLHCPYKSPQSWAFLRLVTSSPVRFAINLASSIILQVLLVPMAPIVLLAEMLNIDTLVWKCGDRLAVTLHLKYLGTINGWDDLDDLWLEERNRCATDTPRTSPNYFHKGTHGTDYDAARGIARIMNSRVVVESMALAVYHCFQRLDTAVVNDELFRLMTQNLPPWLFALEGPRKGRYLVPQTPSVIKEENEMFLLSRLPQTIHNTRPLHVFRLRQLELFVRITVHMFGNCGWEESGLQRDSLSVRAGSKTNTDPGPLFIPSVLKDVKAMKSIPHGFALGMCSNVFKLDATHPTKTMAAAALDIVEQLIKIFEGHISFILAENEVPQPPHPVVDAEPVLGGFMDVLHNISLFLAFNANPTSKEIILITDLAFILDQITARLTISLTRPRQNPQLLRSAKLYASRFHFTDWIPLQRRAPLLARSFQSLVHILSLYGAGGSDYKFSYLTRRYTTQWMTLSDEVLQSSLPSVGVMAPNTQLRDTADANDIVESIHPSIEPDASNVLWMPSASSTTSTSFQSDFREDVGMPTLPAPVLLITSPDRRHIGFPSRRPRVLLKHSFDSDNSYFLHDAGLPRHFESQSQDKVVDHPRHYGSLDCAKAYEMV